MSEGHLRETCDLEGREEDHIVVVVQVVIIGSRERPVELDGAKHRREVLQKKVRVVNSFEEGLGTTPAAGSRKQPRARESLGSCTLP
jgi:hypothetical protein